jgi:hypothetical protein
MNRKDNSEAKAKAIHAFSMAGTYRAAAAASGVDRVTIYRWLDRDPEFAKAWQNARLDWCDRLVETMVGRAMDPKGKSNFLALVSLLNAYIPEFGWKKQEMVESVMTPFLDRLSKILKEALPDAQADDLCRRLAAEAADIIQGASSRK